MSFFSLFLISFLGLVHGDCGHRSHRSEVGSYRQLYKAVEQASAWGQAWILGSEQKEPEDQDIRG